MKPKKPNKIAINKLLNRALELSIELANYKVLFKEMDQITVELMNMDVFEAIIDGCRMTIADNFAQQNTCFRVARFNRYELKIDNKPPALPKKKASHGKWTFPIRRS